MQPRCIKESCHHLILVPTILKATTLGNKVAWVPCQVTGPLRDPVATQPDEWAHKVATHMGTLNMVAMEAPTA